LRRFTQDSGGRTCRRTARPQRNSSRPPHHAEARSAESPADFIHKLKIAVKELNESEVWLRIILASDMLPASRLEDLLDECDQLQRILSSSIKTARQSLET
jgi:four helix bundle protein